MAIPVVETLRLDGPHNYDAGSTATSFDAGHSFYSGSEWRQDEWGGHPYPFLANDHRACPCSRAGFLDGALLQQFMDPVSGRVLNRNYSGYLVHANVNIQNSNLVRGHIRRGYEPVGNKKSRRAYGHIGRDRDHECRPPRN
jgi:hypothetical protein